MKGSGCVRVTASGACAIIGSLKDVLGVGQTLLSIRCSATTFVQKMFRPIMSSTDAALAATQSSAKASGDETTRTVRAALSQWQSRSMASRRIAGI